VAKVFLLFPSIRILLIMDIIDGISVKL